VHLVGIYTIEYNIEEYYRILIHVRTVAITVNETWNDHEQDGRITLSFEMAHNGPKRVYAAEGFVEKAYAL